MFVAESTLAFHRQLETLVSEGCDGLNAEHYATLTRYYSSMKNNPRQSSFYRYNWTRRVTPMQDLISSLPSRELPWSVLDAGCGVGTEALFWATLRPDVHVVGVDASTERLCTARARLACCAPRSPHPLRISFLSDDVFRVLTTHQFDIIWVMETISHIDPAEAFIAQARSALTPEGYLVISDSNILNPVMAWRELRLRLRGVHHSLPMATETGAIVRTAVERYFSPGRLARLLRQSGFELVEVQLSVFFPPFLFRSEPLSAIIRRLDPVFGQLPGLRAIGGVYTLVARSR